MFNDIIKDITTSHNEILHENKKIIGKYYTIIKTYPDERYNRVIKARLKDKKYNVQTSRYNQKINYYIFDDHIYYYKDGKQIPELLAPLNEPFPCYVPEIRGSGLISTKFYEIIKISDKMKQEIILSIIKNEFNRKTGIPEDIFKYVIKMFLL
jgi:hypothetical protein